MNSNTQFVLILIIFLGVMLFMAVFMRKTILKVGTEVATISVTAVPAVGVGGGWPTPDIAVTTSSETFEGRIISLNGNRILVVSDQQKVLVTTTSNTVIYDPTNNRVSIDSLNENSVISGKGSIRNDSIEATEIHIIEMKTSPSPTP